MFAIPNTYKENNEDYITLPVIIKFLKDHNITTKSSDNREKLINYIEEYANISEENKNVVALWIDNVLQEGIKDIHLSYAVLSDKLIPTFSSLQTAQNYLDNFITVKNRHLCNNSYTSKLETVDINIEKMNNDTKIIFLFCKKLHIHDKKRNQAKAIDFPIIAEYYLESNWLLVRVKPRSNLYLYDENGFNIDRAISTTTEKQIAEVKKRLKTILNFMDIERPKIINTIKRSVFELLDKYTSTPDKISEKLKAVETDIDLISQKIIELCNIPTSNNYDVISDVSNLFEKYISIYYPDKNVFIDGREAYPTKLLATDDEESKVEQIAAEKDALQTKSIFFDNKKMIYKLQQCDGVKFKWRRKNILNNQKEHFTVIITTNNKGECTFKFTEYTSREDIENVLFSIIGVK